MLLSLRLTGFAVMEEVEVAFGPGLTVLTGETGAGKSMLLGALGLLIGGRAEVEVVRAGAEEAIVEGIFERSAVLSARLAEFGLPDDGPEVSVRRSVGRGGRGRVHVNAALTTVGVLARLMKGLVDIAGQHEHMALFDPGVQLRLVDRFAGLDRSDGALAEYVERWGQLKACEKRVAALGGDAGEVQARRDLLAFQLEEIARVAPQLGEDTLLEKEHRRLASIERLRGCVGQAEELLATQDGAATELLGRAVALVVEGERLDPALSRVREALEMARSELEAATHGLSRHLSTLEADPNRLEIVDDRLDVLRRLCRKHAAPLEGVLSKQHALAVELGGLERREESRAEAERERAAALEALMQKGKQLSVARADAGARLGQAVLEGLARLCMARARFEVLQRTAAPRADGCDDLEFLFCANPGEPLRPLAKVASGGEASRVMLAVKAALAESDGCESSVFDEADAGVGGAVADVVGRLIKRVATHRQVLCITHLPQVAAHADVHLRIEKGEAKGRVRSVVRVLEDQAERANEVARMLSGLEVSREAVGAACALLRAAGSAAHPARARRRALREEGPRALQQRGP
jgi:DNA repair protein RecN (Recombination protein N)